MTNWQDMWQDIAAIACALLAAAYVLRKVWLGLAGRRAACGSCGSCADKTKPAVYGIEQGGIGQEGIGQAAPAGVEDPPRA